MLQIHTWVLANGSRTIESHATLASLLPAVFAALRAGKAVRLTGEDGRRIRSGDVDAMIHERIGSNAFRRCR